MRVQSVDTRNYQRQTNFKGIEAAGRIISGPDASEIGASAIVLLNKTSLGKGGADWDILEAVAKGIRELAKEEDGVDPARLTLEATPHNNLIMGRKINGDTSCVSIEPVGTIPERLLDAYKKLFQE